MSYQPTIQSLRQHPVPQWYQDAKLGIFVHWGLYSVPAWAPTGYTIRELLRRMSSGEVKLYEAPYAEWYENNIKLEDSLSRKYHKETFGENFKYEAFAPVFNREIEKWDAHEWACLFKETGAKYVVLTTKHHEGFTLWQSKIPNPWKPNYFASRDIVGELTAAVRRQGLHMGLYYSGGLDWTFNPKPIREIADLFVHTPQQPAYARYCMGHWYELIDRYEPELLWNDIGMPNKASLEKLFADYYNRFPEGVVNDRFQKGMGPLSGIFKLKPLKKWLSKMMTNVLMTDSPSNLDRRGHCDYATPEYSVYRDITSKKWESTRGMGRSFGFNQLEQEQDTISITELVHLLVDIVSKNGNLLLNVGPRADGSISSLQVDRLKGLGQWLQVNGEALFATSPWVRAEGKCLDGEVEIPVRFTQRGEMLHAILLGTPVKPTMRLKGLRAEEGSSIELFGIPGNLEWRQEGDDLLIVLDERLQALPTAGNAYSLAIVPQPQYVESEDETAI